MKVNIGLPQKQAQQVMKLLNVLLADEYVLYTKTLNYHWNMTGPHFNHMHKFFEQHYEILLGFADDVAERVRALGGRALGTMIEFSKVTRLKEEPGKKLDIPQMSASLLADHESIIRYLRSTALECTALQDDVTNNFLIELAEKHEKMAWMLRASLE